MNTPNERWDDDDPLEAPASLASFLNHFASPAPDDEPVEPCPECGFQLVEFRRQHRLGCPQCYRHFRREILPVLSSYHRHASHLGKIPARAGTTVSRQGEMTRLRVALEKAIRQENYEEAARLRDTMRNLTAGSEGETTDPDGSL